MNRDELERRVTHDLICFNLIRRPIETMLCHDPGARLVNLAASLLLSAANSGICLSHTVARECGSRLIDLPMLCESVRDRLKHLIDSRSKPRNPILLFPAVNNRDGVLFRIELRDTHQPKSDSRAKELDIHDSGWFRKKNGTFIRDMLDVFGPGVMDSIDPAHALGMLEIAAFTRRIPDTRLDSMPPPAIAWNGLDSADLAASIAVLTHFLGGVNCRIVATGRVENGQVRRIDNLRCKLDLTRAEVPDLDVVFIPKENESEVDASDLPIRAVESIDDVFRYLLDNSCSSPGSKPLREIARSYEVLYKSIPETDPRAAFLKSRIMSRLHEDKLGRPDPHERNHWANAVIHRAFIHHANFELNVAEEQYRRLHELAGDTRTYNYYRDQILSRHAAVLTALYRFDDALALIRQSRGTDDNEDSVPSAIRGECHMLAGQFETAELQFYRVESEYSTSSDTPRLAAYWMRLHMLRGEFDAALERMDEAIRILERYPNNGQMMYIRQCEVKLRYLMGQWSEALDLAQQLEQAYRQTLHHHWPGVLWRRFGGLAALKLGQRDLSRRLMLPDTDLPSPAPILRVHACAPLIDFRLDELERSGKLDPGLLEELAPLRWPPVTHHFSGDLRELKDLLETDGVGDRLRPLLSEIARKIYE